MRILVVDDEQPVASLLGDAIQAQGHDAIVVHSGSAALAELGQQRPDAVFLDIQLQDMSGIRVLREIRSRDQSLPVIIITGHAQPKELDEARTLGVSEVVEKPYVLNRLAEALDLTLRPRP